MLNLMAQSAKAIIRPLIKGRSPSSISRLSESLNILSQLIDYYCGGSAYCEYWDIPDVKYINGELEKLEIHSKSYSIDSNSFIPYYERAVQTWPLKYQEGYGDLFKEKVLEHYISKSILRFDSDDIYVDIGAGSAYFYSGIIADKYECQGYSMDYEYPEGINGNKISCDATDTSLTDDFCTKATLHCAFETFENENDILLLNELARIIKPAGEFVIVPLYVHQEAHILSSPTISTYPISYHDEKRVWRRNFARASRFYSPYTLKRRVISQLKEFTYTVYHITNIKEVVPNGYCYYVLHCRKKI